MPLIFGNSHIGTLVFGYVDPEGYALGLAEEPGAGRKGFRVFLYYRSLNNFKRVLGYIIL